MAQSAANRRNTHIHMDRSHSYNHCAKRQRSVVVYVCAQNSPAGQDFAPHKYFNYYLFSYYNTIFFITLVEQHYQEWPAGMADAEI